MLKTRYETRMCLIIMNKTKLCMDLTSKSVPLLFHAMIMLFCFAVSLPSVKPISNESSLVYKSCADQTHISSTMSHAQTLSSLFEELVLQSSKSKFFKTTHGSDDDQTAIYGLFQCREDISNEDCGNCVKALPAMSSSLCKQAESARVQLPGCYIRYEPDWLPNEYSENKLLHKTCGEPNPLIGGFVEMRDAAFSALEGGIASSGGFCKTSYELVQVMAQCEGEMEACECGECINKAVRIAQEECGTAVSGEIYLDKCFMSYSYSPEGVPGRLNPGKGESKGGNSSNGKIVAIVLGGAAALVVGYIFLLVIKSWMKKDDDDLV